MSLISELNQFQELFKRHLQNNSKAALRWVSVTSVNWDNKTMTAVDSDGLEYLSVLLGLGAKMVKPAVDSDCLIAIIEGDETSALLLYAENAELDERNGGELGGMIIIAQLVEKLNGLVAEVNALTDLYNSHVHVTTATVGASSTVGVLSATTSQAQDSTEFDKDDFEDITITH